MHFNLKDTRIYGDGGEYFRPVIEENQVPNQHTNDGNT